jgi:hypothetical protein
MATISATALTSVIDRRVHELIADARLDPPLVTGAIVDGRRVRWPLPGAPGQPEGELLLVRDLLDVQVLDRDGHHRGCIGEVELVADAEGRLRVVAVETGLAPVLRRLGLKRFAGYATSIRLEWHDLATAPERPHAVRSRRASPRHLYRGVLRVRRRPPR